MGTKVIQIERRISGVKDMTDNLHSSSSGARWYQRIVEDYSTPLTAEVQLTDGRVRWVCAKDESLLEPGNLLVVQKWSGGGMRFLIHLTEES